MTLDPIALAVIAAALHIARTVLSGIAVGCACVLIVAGVADLLWGSGGASLSGLYLVVGVICIVTAVASMVTAREAARAARALEGKP